MGSQAAGNLIAALTLAATVLLALVGVNATFETSSWGSAPPKRLEASYIGPSDPLEDLADAKDSLSIAVTTDGRPVRNLRIVQATLQNSGRTPILASDMFEPLGIKADQPWLVLAVANQGSLGDLFVKLKWRRLDDQRFASEPVLLNPGDRVYCTGYLVWKGEGPVPSASESPVRWTGRIANLRAIDTEPDPITALASVQGPISVWLWGWGVPFFMLQLLVYNLLTTLLAWRAGLLGANPLHWAALALATLLNVAAADAGTTFVFGMVPNTNLPVSAGANLPPILTNIALLLGLGVAAKRRRERTEA